MIPLSLGAPLTPTERITELERLVADLQRAVLEQAGRLAALEARASSARSAPGSLVQRNARRAADARALRAAIADILSTHRRASAKEVIAELMQRGVEHD